MTTATEPERVKVTPETLQQVVVVQPDGRVTAARLLGLVRWGGTDVLTYTVQEEGE